MANEYIEQPKDKFNYGDNMNSSYSGYIKKDYVIRFENARIAKDEQDVVEFKAFITAFKDLFKPEWNEETVFGRTEPIGIYKGISRRLSFAFDAPADSVVEGKDNLSKTEDLVKMLYPTYHQPGTDPNYRILSQAPLIRLSFVNIINDHKNQKGLLGYITSFDYDLNFGKDIGVFDGQEKFLTPRLISFNIDFTVLHEIPLGYGVKNGGDFMDGKFASDKGWLYGVDEGEIAKATKQAQRARAEKEETKDKVAQQAGDAEQASGGTAELSSPSPAMSDKNNIEDTVGGAPRPAPPPAGITLDDGETIIDLVETNGEGYAKTSQGDYYYKSVGGVKYNQMRNQGGIRAIENNVLQPARAERNSGIGIPPQPPAVYGDLKGRGRE